MLSVVMPAFNTDRFISHAIQSVEAQDCACPVELIVVDDGSTDRTAACVAGMALQKITLRMLDGGGRGVSHARNLALRNLSPDTEFVAFLDSDDIFPEGRLSQDLARFAADPALQLVFGLQCLVTSEAADLRADIASRKPTIRSANLGSATFRRSLIESTGFFDETLTHGEDLDYFLRIFERAPHLCLHDDIGVYYRQRRQSACTQLGPLLDGVARAVANHKDRLAADPRLIDVATMFEDANYPRALAIANTAYFDANGYPDYSVVIPAYNAEAFLDQALHSVFAQSHPPAEVIVVNDGSQDATQGVIDRWAAKEPRILAVAQDNCGPAEATNAGVRRASHEFIAFLDADDLWEPDKTRTQMRALFNNRGAEIVFCKMVSFRDGDDAPFVDDDQSGWSRSTALVRKSVFDKVGYLQGFRRGAGEMIDWIARTREEGVYSVFLDAFLAKRRLHGTSLTAGKRDERALYAEVARAAILRQRERAKNHAQ
ncbi:glycosyltransferase family 2 protein [Yoonia sp.]|uniref:glycosyltransferase family 2 protein n=1 Tax=Yoonia sp. TaxID=2212373 RepID=UPI002FDA137A